MQWEPPIKEVALTMTSKTSLNKNFDNIMYKMQKPCNENPSLKFRETQSFTKSLSVSTAEGFPRFTSIIIAA